MCLNAYNKIGFYGGSFLRGYARGWISGDIDDLVVQNERNFAMRPLLVDIRAELLGVDWHEQMFSFLYDGDLLILLYRLKTEPIHKQKTAYCIYISDFASKF